MVLSCAAVQLFLGKMNDPSNGASGHPFSRSVLGVSPALPCQWQPVEPVLYGLRSFHIQNRSGCNSTLQL